jgi:iron only hydrogenase large subunit-like protein
MFDINGLDDNIDSMQECETTFQIKNVGKIIYSKKDEYIDINDRFKSREIINSVNTEYSEKSVNIKTDDCLACTGCNTESEALSPSFKSIEMAVYRINDSSKTIITSIAPQATSSLAGYYKVDPQTLLERLSSILHAYGVKSTFDTNSSRSLTLIETATEFIKRYKTSEEACLLFGSNTNLPLLCSSCPSSVSFIENDKSQRYNDLLCPSLSAQGVTGRITRLLVCKQLSLKQPNVYLISLMPCGDRKFEAHKEQFKNSDGSFETDCVLTTTEIVKLLNRLGTPSLNHLSKSNLPLKSMLGNHPVNILPRGYYGSSGGYLEFTFRTAVHELFKEEVPNGPLTIMHGSNKYSWEAVWRVGNQIALRFMAIYGFRNFHALLRNIQREHKRIHFVEIMACPLGCLNGRGQFKEFLKTTAAFHTSFYVHMNSPLIDPLVTMLYGGKILDRPNGFRAKKVLHCSDISNKSLRKGSQVHCQYQFQK